MSGDTGIEGLEEIIMETRCRAGDLAVVIHAHYPSNIGRIVRVISPQDSKGDLVFLNAGAVWLTESSQPMTWSVGKRRIRRKRGPIPDTYLQPIRGNPVIQQCPIFRSKQEQASQFQNEPAHTEIDDPQRDAANLETDR
jgi:hypothetical protein